MMIKINNDMKTLNEEIDEIKKMNCPISQKKSALVKLGLRKYDIEVLLADMPRPIRETHSFTFGVEIECLVEARLVRESAQKNGVFFAHNGMLPIPSVDDKTDSEIAFREDIYPAIERFGFGSVGADNAINSIIGGSRFALMYKGETRLYGNFSKIGNVYYSNLNWLYYHG